MSVHDGEKTTTRWPTPSVLKVLSNSKFRSLIPNTDKIRARCSTDTSDYHCTWNSRLVVKCLKNISWVFMSLLKTSGHFFTGTTGKTPNAAAQPLTAYCLRQRLHNHKLTFRHRASCILGQAFHYSLENAFYIFNQQTYFINWYLLDCASLI